MKTFKHITPSSRIFFGPDCLAELKKELHHAGSSRPMIFCDPCLVGSPLLQMVSDEIGDMCAGVFSEIVPASPVPDVMKAADAIKEAGADALIVIGGGSSAVTARAAVIIAAEGKDPHKLCTYQDEASGKMVSPRLNAPKIPMLCIPTTPITACIKGGASIVDRETNHQLPLFDPKTRGTAIFIHPEFVRTVPEKLLMSSSMSTLAACIDALFSSKSEPLSDALLIHALRLLYGALSKPEELESVEKRCDIMLATMLVGMGSDFTGFGISVSVGHAISAMYPLNAGLLNGVTIPYTVEFNQKAEEGMSKLAIGMNIDPEAADRNEQVLAKVNSMLNALPIPHSFSEMGMPEGKFDEIAALAMDDWYLHFNPMPVDAEKLAALIGKAY